jgi:hypothetical protein
VHFGEVNININNRINTGNINVRDNNLYRDKAQKANVAQTRDFRPATQETRDRVSQADRAGSRDRMATADRSTAAASRPAGAKPSTARNNVYADKSGNVYRKTDGGWQKNDGNKWNNVPSTGGGAASRPSASSPTRTSPSNYQGATTRQGNASTRQSSAYNSSNSGYSNRSSLDRQSHSRQRSSTRSTQYSAQRSNRGGGGRRR